MTKPIAFIMVEGGQTWIRTTAETEEAIRTGFITETTPLYKKREPLSDVEVLKIAIKIAGDIGIEHDPTDFEGTGVFELARAIEKAHGIGVDDE